MFHTFTGNSRRPRNVDLSGQNRNPFASVAQTSMPGGLGGPTAVAQAQQERRARQIERDRHQAARTLQRCWRGHQDRRKAKTLCRRAWDEGRGRMEASTSRFIQVQASARPTIADGASNFRSQVDLREEEEIELQRARMLAWFARSRDQEDVARVLAFEEWLKIHIQNLKKSGRLKSEWRVPLVKLAKFCLEWFNNQAATSPDGRVPLIELLAFVTISYAESIAALGAAFYTPLGKLASKITTDNGNIQQQISSLLLAPLTSTSRYQENAYEGFIMGIMTVPDIHKHLNLEYLAPIAINGRLARSLRRLLTRKPSPLSATTSDTTVAANTRLLWVMAYFIRLHRSSAPMNDPDTSDIDFVYVISSFLSRLGGEIGQHSDFSDTTDAATLPNYVREKVISLVNQESISNLFAHSEFASTIQRQGTNSENVSVLASYALTLLQVFPRKADEVRQWLYLSSRSASSNDLEPEPAVKYFWKAVVNSSIYKGVLRSSTNAVELIRQGRSLRPDTEVRDNADQEWRVILLFLELYSFVLRIMDDDEFMAGSQPSSKFHSRVRQSALDLDQVRELTVFLKNFAFAMYWNADAVLKVEKETKPETLAYYFGRLSAPPKTEKEEEVEEVPAFAGVEGMTMGYMKGMATGLLRALYERDSRRSFCEPDHWLMKDIELRGFIDAVVVEQAVRNDVDEAYDNEETRLAEEGDDSDSGLVGTSRAQQIRRLARLKFQQRRATRSKLLQNMTPRLETLQNMPFFIPFTTRVEIFHHFVTSDQTQRRDGFVDPDQWRMFMETSMLPGGQRNRRVGGRPDLSRHTAQVRRDHVFDDAFEQFYELGEGLKEPIQITFVDQFGTTEAGIDGGGVTKEFLTSVANEAFSPDKGLGLFVENDQHLLYPNSSALDEQRTLLREFGIEEGSSEWNARLRDLLQRYEFLGRVVGKCLYEGILIDVQFAPFFLVKWALTGGDNAGSRETGYRATLNDLRDLDEALYQGLLELKNYPGNVEDFALDFTVNDVVARPGRGQPDGRVITRELRAGWADTPVTNTNRLVYVSDMARHRLQTQPAAQTHAFLKGLGALVPPAWLSMFNRRELQTLLGGAAAEIDVADLRRNTLYGGVYAIGDDGLEHPTVQLFWSVLAEFDDAERRKLLKYVTSTPRAPLLGFTQLNPRFSIRDSGNDQTRLPSTSTCVNLLKLPIYTSREALKVKLSYAINAGAGFNLS